MNRFVLPCLVTALGASAALGDTRLPPFDFSDDFYRANGVNPAGVIGRPTGTGANSVIDNRENGAKYTNVRVTAQAAAYDHSGHRIFFYVVGITGPNTFLDNAAGQRTRQIADQYKVYEFPRAANPQFAVFPKRQDLIADLRNGYFSNDPLGLWQVNDVRYTLAAFEPAARSTMNDLAARNGRDLDGTPIIKTISEIESLRAQGLVTIETPPLGGTALRWFFCPVIEDPRNGAIAPDAHLDATESTDAAEFRRQFTCLQTTGDFCSNSGRSSDCDGDGRRGSGDIFAYLGWFFSGDSNADFDDSGNVSVDDLFVFLGQWFSTPG